LNAFILPYGAPSRTTQTAHEPEKSVVLYTEMGHRHEIAKSLSVLGKVLATEGDYAAAQALFEQSLSITGKLGEKWVAIVYLLELGEVVAAQRQFAWAARVHLGERAFAAAWAQGRTMTPEQALAAAWASRYYPRQLHPSRQQPPIPMG